jgi:DNA polymerase III subunit alpha
LASEAAPVNNGERSYGGPSRTVTVAGLVMDLRKRGNRVSLVLDDRTGRMEVTLFEDAYNRFRTLAVKDNVVIAEGRLTFDTFINAWRVTVKDMFGIDELRERYVKRLDIHWQAEGVTPEFAVRLKETLKPYLGGRCAVWVGYRGSDASVPVPLGDGWRVHPSEALVRKLETWLGTDRVALHYGPRMGVNNRETADA